MLKVNKRVTTLGSNKVKFTTLDLVFHIKIGLEIVMVLSTLYIT